MGPNEEIGDDNEDPDAEEEEYDEGMVQTELVKDLEDLVGPNVKGKGERRVHTFTR